MNITRSRTCLIAGLFLITLGSCHVNEKPLPTAEAIKAIDLKRGDIIVCGASNQQFGSVGFASACAGSVQKDFDLAIALLHSFEYDEAEKVFAKIIDAAPTCATAYWGVAMCNYHPLWAPPTQTELKKGARSIAIAQSLMPGTGRESAYINAMAAFYKDWDKTEHRTRSSEFANAMQRLYKQYPTDKETAIFYALSLTAAADPADKTYKNQRTAGAILNALYAEQPNHPGVVHYLIHTYDTPELAKLGLPAARKYASVAPSSAHALHMPSHIFTRLGLWDECIRSNVASVSSAKCYAEQAGMTGHWDEELHGLDYLVYAYLQKGDNDRAKAQLNYLQTISVVSPTNFKVAYAFAAIPSRYVLENRLWSEAMTLKLHPANLPWQDYPWQKAILHYARAMGAVQLGKTKEANAELAELSRLHASLVESKDTYKAKQVQIQLKTAEAWLRLKEWKSGEALQLMNTAADLEDGTEKHAVTPGAMIPAREMLGDMLLELNQSALALAAYETNLKKSPNRFNGLYGAGKAAAKSNNPEKAAYYFRQLRAIANSTHATRPELETARRFLNQHNAVTHR